MRFVALKVLEVLHVRAEVLAQGDFMSAIMDDLNYISYIDGGVCNLVPPLPPPPLLPFPPLPLPLGACGVPARTKVQAHSSALTTAMCASMLHLFSKKIACSC